MSEAKIPAKSPDGRARLRAKRHVRRFGDHAAAIPTPKYRRVRAERS